MILSFHPCFDADHHILLGDRELGPSDHDLIQRAAAIILPQGCSKSLYLACRESPAEVFPDYGARFLYPGKVGQSLLFKKAGCPHPETSCWSDSAEFKRFLAQQSRYPHSLPFLIKMDGEHEGTGIFEVLDRNTLEKALEEVAARERRGRAGFLTQKQVASKGNVLRVVILGKRLISYWKRSRGGEQAVTTLAKGAVIDKEWRRDLQEKGRTEVASFSSFTGINLAAVDIVFDLDETDPLPLFLEVNYYFGRRGLGGTLNYYRLLYRAVREWLEEKGLDPSRVRLC
ncbi:MAG: hypothetical protein JRH13_03490 [Deltaproteobacteria bacterium]|nr:hypothetical protein [Deltaproteobacteria bacterium]MBW2015461.1 hypothetical protein [Deltaproteobacteria bacterium]MBW2128410.1 hypothetical protein [Deltaproteobacteria bacterium]MBW2304377.1 hypothetical protein [Deltaproteobacteria bacterium]